MENEAKKAVNAENPANLTTKQVVTQGKRIKIFHLRPCFIA